MNVSGTDETFPPTAPAELAERPLTVSTVPDAEEDDEEDIDETLSERLWGLTEMFPESVRGATGYVVSNGWSLSKWMYEAGRTTLWVLASSTAILALPVLFEADRAQMEEQQIQQQRQIMLGPNAAMAGIHPGAMPQIAPPAQR